MSLDGVVHFVQVEYVTAADAERARALEHRLLREAEVVEQRAPGARRSDEEVARQPVLLLLRRSAVAL